jgi:hypothetical protein
VIGKLRKPSASLFLGAAGGLLALSGCVLLVVLALAGTGGAAQPDLTDGQPPVHSGAATDAAPGTFSPEAGAATPGGRAAGAPALVLGPDGEPVPYWKAKQEEARRQARQDAADSETARPAGENDVADAGQDDDSPAPSQMQAAAATPTTAPPAPPSPPTTQPPAVKTTRVVGSGGSTPLEGVWGGTARELADYLLSANPSPQFSVPTLRLAEYYVRYAAEVSLRADVLWAQMIHETGWGKYGGSVSGHQNNYAGIGATGGSVPGHTFPTAEEGVKGHVAHMVAYAYHLDMASWTNSQVDPRYDMVQPRGLAKVLSDLDGRWAVPGVGYGERIERHVRALNP